MENPAAGVASAAYDRTGQTDFLAAFNGLSAVPQAVRDLLPPKCRSAFDAAVASEVEWKSRWAGEGEKTCRQKPVIDKAIVPYSMS